MIINIIIIIIFAMPSLLLSFLCMQDLMSSPEIEIQVTQSAVDNMSTCGGGADGLRRPAFDDRTTPTDVEVTSTRSADIVPSVRYGLRPTSGSDERRSQETSIVTTCELLNQQRTKPTSLPSTRRSVTSRIVQPEVDASTIRLERILDAIGNSLDRHERRQVELDRRDLVRIQWQQVSIVVDRALLVVFVGATIAASAAILFNAPHSIDFLFGVEPATALSNVNRESNNISGSGDDVQRGVPVVTDVE